MLGEVCEGKVNILSDITVTIHVTERSDKNKDVTNITTMVSFWQKRFPSLQSIQLMSLHTV